MDETFAQRIDKLRKTSRTLLAKVDESLKQIDDEAQILNSQRLSVTKNYKNHSKHQNQGVKKVSKSWKLRNDSSSITKALDQNLTSNSPRHISASMPNIVPTRKIVIPSKKHCKRQSGENAPRKPVKGCYCNVQIKKSKSKRTQQKHEGICRCCKSYSDFRPILLSEDTDRQTLTPVSCRTLRGVEKIDYAPRSQFLRNVQNKISKIYNVPIGDTLESHPRSQCNHEALEEHLQARRNQKHTVCCRAFKRDAKNSNVRQESKSVPEEYYNAETSDDEYREHEISSETSRPSPQRQLKPQVIKKTFTSKKSITEPKTARDSRSPAKKRTTEVRHSNCHCCSRNLEKFSNSSRKSAVSPVCFSPKSNKCCTNIDRRSKDNSSDVEIRNVHKFREENYFDTHGSSHTLLSSRSSGSLEQYLLNERLFPEPVRRVHKRDLVVTMPPCSTTQRKRIHYFPRYVVKQRKNGSPTNQKKKRCPSCPLTGHAIDLGVLKVHPPVNSLALKYQKQAL